MNPVYSSYTTSSVSGVQFMYNQVYIRYTVHEQVVLYPVYSSYTTSSVSSVQFMYN